MKTVIYDDFYVIELWDRIKIGVTNNFGQRLNTIKNAAGISEDDNVEILFYPNCGNIEKRLKRLFKKHQTRGEWYYKEEIVYDFLSALKRGQQPTIELWKQLIEKYAIKEFEYDDNVERAILLLNAIKRERKGIGFPDSVDIKKFIRTKKAYYRNWVYTANDDFTAFERKPNFKYSDMTFSRGIECLRILKNNDKNKSIFYQNLVDDLFYRNEKSYHKIEHLIKYHFFSEENPHIFENYKIRVKYSDKDDMYYFQKYFLDLNTDEKRLIRKNENFTIYVNNKCFGFSIRDKMCYCFYHENEQELIEDFLKEKKCTFDVSVREYKEAT